jgi:ribosomal-protein-alanine N-acetyltransferase
VSGKLNIPCPELFTKRLRLRQLTDDDAKDLFTLRAHPKVNVYIGRVPPKKTTEIIAFISKINTGLANGELLYWGISRINSSQLIGTICLWNYSADLKTAEIGFELHPAYQGKGFMSEAVKCILAYTGTNLPFSKLQALTHRNNKPSKRLLKNQGFKLISGLKDPNKADNVVFEYMVEP